eukprot:1146567-Pelagomonas_calceolata.AAC.3
MGAGPGTALGWVACTASWPPGRHGSWPARQAGCMHHPGAGNRQTQSHFPVCQQSSAQQNIWLARQAYVPLELKEHRSASLIRSASSTLALSTYPL